MQHLFDQLTRKIEHLNEVKSRLGTESEIYIQAEGEAIDALNDYIDKRIEEKTNNN